jgi:UDP-N-acetylglucosamine/UDP-N-acetylgalactosamine diphosphorylase
MNKHLVDDHKELIMRVEAAGQGHVFRYWDQLDEARKERLASQLRAIDFDLLTRLRKQFIQAEQRSDFRGNLEPIEPIPLPRTDWQRQRHAEAREAGEQALHEGRVAAFLVAGGQGTRLGFPGPKGTFPIGPVSGKSLFQLHAEKLLALRRRYRQSIRWYIMTSETNHADTISFFAKHDFFGLDKNDVHFFPQEMVPALDENGLLILDDKDHIFTSPNGHGGSLQALAKNGALFDMKQRGIDIIFYFQVDNVLIKMCDPVFLGYHILEGAEMSAKVTAKRDPWEKVGVIGRIDGRVGVVEYSDLPDEEKTARNPDGSLKYNTGNLAIHVLSVSFVEKETRGRLKLPWHVAHKRIPYLDDNGQVVFPEEPNGYKFETFVFDALGDAEKVAILEVDRSEEFSPVKNAEGVDSPETARRDLSNHFARWLEGAGVRVPRDADGNAVHAIEISPLYALDAEELKKKLPSDFSFEGDLYLD